MLDVIEYGAGLAIGAKLGDALVLELLVNGGEDGIGLERPRRLKSMASSLMRAMLTSRWVFSMTLAASATRMLAARWVPAVMMRR